MASRETALIVGVGKGLSASLARLFHNEGMTLALAARNVGKLGSLAAETEARTYRCDASRPQDVTELFEAVAEDLGVPALVVYNPSYRVRGPIADLDPREVEKALMITCYGGFLVGQAAARCMVPRGRGTILFTGASASIKGFANSASFAMGKFGLRGLAQSMARELHPKGVHVAHFVIDGGILQGGADPRAETRGVDGMLHPDEIARTYLHAHRQHRSAWTHEIELRPWVEPF